MPIKSFTFAFKLDAKELLAYVVEHNIAVDIHATGTKRLQAEAEAQLPSPAVLALPPPTFGKGSGRGSSHKKGRIGSKEAMLLFLATTKNATPIELKESIAAAGYSRKTYSSQMYALLKQRLVAHTGKNQYRILAKGLKQVGGE